MDQRLLREAIIWHSVSHKNVAPFLGLCYDLGPSPGLIYHLYVNGDVHQYLLKNPKSDRLAIIIAIARGLHYLHSVMVIHGDIKLSNILIDDNGTALLADFGQSKITERRGFTTVTFAGTARQMAPELVPKDSDEEAEAVGVMTREADVYAFSMVALEILTGKIPFFSVVNDMSVMFKVLNGKRPERKSYPQDTFSDIMWGILIDCWNQDPEERPDMRTVIQRLEVI